MLLENIEALCRAPLPPPRRRSPERLNDGTVLLPGDFVKSMCDVQDNIPEVSRLQTTGNGDDLIHASALIGLCVRQYTLARQYGVDHGRTNHGGDRVTWAMGLAAEAHVVKQVKAYHGEDNVITDLVGVDEDLGVVYRPDLVIRVANDLAVVAEVKMMNVDDWNALEEPRADHVLQVALYRELLVRSRVVFVDPILPHVIAILLYVSRTYVWGSPYKEFHVNTDTPHVQGMVNTALQLARDLKQVNASNQIHGHRPCTTPDCQQSKDCQLSTMCWNLPADPPF